MAMTNYYRAVSDEVQMMWLLMTGLTLTVGVDSSSWRNYDVASLSPFAGCTTAYKIDHSVNIVGFKARFARTDDLRENILPGSYWIIRNSWGTGWG